MLWQQSLEQGKTTHTSLCHPKTDSGGNHYIATRWSTQEAPAVTVPGAACHCLSALSMGSEPTAKEAETAQRDQFQGENGSSLMIPVQNKMYLFLGRERWLQGLELLSLVT